MDQAKQSCRQTIFIIMTKVVKYSDECHHVDKSPKEQRGLYDCSYWKKTFNKIKIGGHRRCFRFKLV
jgi:hypothetical protein